MTNNNAAQKTESNEGQTKKDQQKMERDYAVIRFPKRNRAQDPPIVSVGVNGAKYRMKRNELIPVPKAVVSTLRNAKEPVVEDEEDNIGGSLHIIRRRKIIDFAPRFSFELYAWVSEDAYKKLRKIALKRSLSEEEVNKIIFS